MKLQELHEGKLTDKIKAKFDELVDRNVLNPKYLKKYLNQFGLGIVTLYVTTKLPEAQKATITKQLHKWLPKHKDDEDFQDLSNILYSLDGTKVS
jgi:hypothetical protein